MLKQRSQPRFPPRTAIAATFAVGTALGQGWVENLSRDGLFLRTPVLPKGGEAIRLALQPPTGPSIEVRGRVRWKSTILAEARPTGFGVALFDYGSDYSALLGRVIRERDETTADRDET